MAERYQRLRRNMDLYPEVWRVKYYGIHENGDEGNFTALIIAPHLEDVFEVVRTQLDDCAIFESVSHATAHFSGNCFEPIPELAAREPRGGG